MIDWKRIVTAEAAKAAAFAKAKTDAIAEVVAAEMAKEDAARIDRATVLVGKPATMAELETTLRDAKAAP